jgi:streptogramin lyase
MTADGNHVWWTQIQGNLGSFNTETLQVETVVEFPMGSGPRRLAIDEHDVAWVPLYGASQLLAYDTKAQKEVARYNMPRRSAASYNGEH